MKKNLKKVLSLVLALAMVFTMSATAFAEETASTSSVTVVNNLSDHSFNAYQIMAGTYSTEAKDLTDVTWGSGVNSDALLAALKEVEAYEDCTTVEDVEAVLVAATDDAVINAFVEAAYACRTTVSASIAAEATSVELASGYYLIVDSTSNVSGTTVKAYNNALLQVVGTTVTIAKKTDSPSVEKKVQEIGYTEDGSAYVAEYNDVADYSIGDEIGYQLIGTVPDLTYYSYYKYIFTDTISKGLTIDKDSIVVYAANDKSSTTGWVEIDSSAYTVSYSDYEGTNTADVYYGGSVMKVSFSDIMTAATADSTKVASDYAYIIVTYKASLNANAVIGLDGNPNKVKLSYSSNPNATGSGDSGSGSESESGSGSESESGSGSESESGSQSESESGSQSESESGSQSESESGSQSESESGSQSESESGSQSESESGSQSESESDSGSGSDTPSESESESGSESGSEPEDDDLLDTPEDEVIVFTYELDVTKVAAENNETTLAGAEFVMYYVDGDTTYYVQIDANNKVTGFTTDETAASTLTSGSDGLIVVSGLEDRTYYIEETKAPTGYNLLSNAVMLTIAATTVNGQTWESGIASEALTALTLTVDSEAAVAGNVNTGVVSTKITNTKGTVLPSTGGIGTTIFYIVGAILVIGAAVVLVTRRRVSR